MKGVEDTYVLSEEDKEKILELEKKAARAGIECRDFDHRRVADEFEHVVRQARRTSFKFL